MPMTTGGTTKNQLSKNTLLSFIDQSKKGRTNTRRNYVAVPNTINRLKKEELVFIKGGYEAQGSSKKSVVGNGTRSSIAQLTNSS